VKAITVEPRKRETAHLEEMPEPDGRGGSVLVEAIAVGVCGTDVEVLEGKYGHRAHPPRSGRRARAK
jgi:D-arabinose 1-dehydrogenase-like Zn-dependent alcohol dehydrogenase